MKIAIVSRDPSRLASHISTISKYSDYYSSDPELIIALGGDGTFLLAEHYFPGIPKLLVRDRSICRKCDWDNLEEGIKRIIQERYRIVSFNKITAKSKNIILEAANDIIIRNIEPTHAIRFSVKLGSKFLGEFIGDGIVVSTAFGSEGYYRSVTGTHFTQGLGLAFNNVTQKTDSFLFSNEKIEFRLLRGYAHLAADNNPQVHSIAEGSTVHISQGKNKANIIKLTA